MSKLYITYFRVSTHMQEASGLGIEAQRRDVATYINSVGGRVIGAFEETESGKRNDRPQLLAALLRCRLTGATLCIAKLDRLTRDLHFLTQLQRDNVDFVACDMPNANKLTVQLMVAMAEQERDAIGVRTKAALKSINERLANGETHVSRNSGRIVTRLGNPNGLNGSCAKLGARANAARSDEFARLVGPRIVELKAQGRSLAAIADKLNEDHILSARGATWSPTGVKRVLERAHA